jgi:hypothetical protein
VQPVGEPLGRGNRPGLASEDQEGRLEGILGVVMWQQPAADPEDKRTMPANERGEGPLIGVVNKTRQELSIRPCCLLLEKSSLELLNNRVERILRHVTLPQAGVRVGYKLLPRRGRFRTFFLAPGSEA